MKKKLIALTSLALAAALLLSACVPPWASKIERAQATATAITENRQAEAIIAAAQVPAGTTDGAPPETAPAAPVDDPQAPVPNGTCSKDALTASHDDNLVSGRYEMSYFGGTSEACYMFGEFNFGHARQTWLLIVPPSWTFNLGGFIGETMWYRDSEGAVAWSITDSTANLTRPDGRNEKTPIVVWVNDPTTLKLLPAEAQYEVIPPPAAK
ncbi:hypothetical protein HYU90_01815 [Candidatus Collierbacteria bacterium]|nr:hypothetical protein [Candidatus Collierbacteria bacterium]